MRPRDQADEAIGKMGERITEETDRWITGATLLVLVLMTGWICMLVALHRWIAGG